MKWQGVLPAITTPFKPDFSVDADLLVKQVDALVRAGCTGVVALGSLGEGGSLSFDEKKAVLRLCREALAGRAPLVAGVAALTTADAIHLAELGADAGCEGLMVLPPYVYKGDWRETRAHFDAVIGATPLPCMLYNNPIAYGTDVVPEQMVDLAVSLPNFVAVKESSADVRRVTALRALLGDRLAILVGVDDLILEGIQAGATGGSRGSPTRCRRSRSGSSTSPRRAGSRRRGRSTTGSCPSCGSTPSRSSSSSSSSSSRRRGSARRRCGRRGCPWPRPSARRSLELVRYALARRPALG